MKKAEKEPTIKQLTERLNQLRITNGKNPLKAWKESKQKCIDAIENEMAEAKTPEPEPKAKIPEPNLFPNFIIPDPVRDNDDSIPEKDTFTISELAEQLGINPKVARAKLRRTTNVPPKVKKGWVFANDAKDALIKILS